MLVEQHADEQRERVAAQQFVGGVVLGDAEGRHTHMVPQGRSGGTGTKLWVQDAGEDATKRAVKPSLGNLGLDHLDLYLIHQPFGDYYGAWRAMQHSTGRGCSRRSWCPTSPPTGWST